MRIKRALAAVLAAAALAAPAVPSARAAYFPDIPDPTISKVVDTLHVLKIVDGDDHGNFLPNDTFTRVQFCKMAVMLMGRGEEAQAHAYRTVFRDVPATHWGLRYVNCAASMTLDEEGKTRLMMGTGGGLFEPERPITYQEAVTILLRILGYAEEADRSWPYEAIRVARDLGLDQGLGVARPSDTLTRTQAALLFTKMLIVVPKGGEKPYAEALGTLVEDAIVLSTNALINGMTGWVTTTAGGPYRPAGAVDRDLVGQRGWALLDEEGRFITLLADFSNCITAVISRKQANYLHTTSGVRYTFSDDTPVYLGATGEVSTYKEQYPNLQRGDTVTIYLKEGKVVGMFRSGITSMESSFVVVRGSASMSLLYSLTGGVTNFTIRKNGSTISLSGIKTNDVLTYDPISRVVHVCDTRLSCVFENASPSPKAPARVTAAGGNVFQVLADAMDSVARFRIGESFTLLFTADGRVAGALSGSHGNAVGVVQGGTIRLSGTDVTLKTDTVEDLNRVEGRLVSVTGARGRLVLSPIYSGYSPGSFEKSSMTLGNLRVSDSVQIYDSAAGTLTPVSLSSLPSSIPSYRIQGYHTDTAGRVDIIILQDVTGDGYHYGRIEPTARYELVDAKGSGKPTPVYPDNDTGKEPTGWVDDKGRPVDEEGYLLDKAGSRVQTKQRVQQLKFVTPDGEKIYDTGGGSVSTGFGAITVYTRKDSQGVEREYASVRSMLTAVTKVRSSSFYDVDGVTYVQAGGKVYEVAGEAISYNAAASTGRWEWDEASQESIYRTKPVWFESLLEARSFSDTLTIYVDSSGDKVRAVSAGG